MQEQLRALRQSAMERKAEAQAWEGRLRKKKGASGFRAQMRDYIKAINQLIAATKGTRIK